MDIFRTAMNATQSNQTQQNQNQQQTQQQQQQTPVNQNQTTPGNMPANGGATSGNTEGTAANGLVPPGSNTEDKTQSSLDAFGDFWKTTTTNNTTDTGIFNIDPQKLQELATKENFTNVVNPELLQKINSGGEGAMQAMLEAMNTMAQQVYLKSAIAATKFSEHAATKTASRLKDELPSTFKNFQVSENLASSNPALNNPAVQPLIELIKNQAVQKFPNATANEIQKYTNDYLTSVFSAVVPQSTQNNSGTNNGGKKTEAYDWSSFLS